MATDEGNVSRPAAGGAVLSPAADASAEVREAIDFPVVGVGASAGGLSAFDAFFSGMPAGAEPGMAFVLVQHLAADHRSVLAALVQRSTQLHVLQIADGMRVQPNCVYVLPPAFEVSLRNGVLSMQLQPVGRGLRMPIDVLFKSLADEQRDQSIAVLLSGTGHDGTIGLRAIKEAGGMTMVQSVQSAEFDGMPRSAIEARLADYELEPSQMPTQLIAYVQHALGPRRGTAAPLLPADQAVMNTIHALLRTRTGHDFSQYKPSTMTRRIERRILRQQIGTLEEYLQLLQHTPSELDALFSELLIGVTRFFRDGEAFKALEAHVIEALLAPRGADDAVRVWCAGCSTGEEAYSVAMLLAEHAQAAGSAIALQVFATDIDRRAIAFARAGLYPPAIAGDLSAERLARHFTLEPGGAGYRIHKRIRDCVMFSEQDVIVDPPFSRLDLLVCRNVLIYLDEQLQKRLIPLFHYALKPGGVLFLGSAEGIGDFGNLFSVLDRKANLYRREPFAVAPIQSAPQRSMMPSMAGGLAGAAVAARMAGQQRSYRVVAERALLDHFDAVGALVTAVGDVVYLHGRSGRFLEPAQGDPQVSNLIRMAREGLAPPLNATLHKAVQTGRVAHADAVRVKTNGDHSLVDVVVRPLPSEAAALDLPLYLVALSLAAAPVQVQSTDVPDQPPSVADLQIAALKAELLAKDEYLLSMHEQLQLSNEELTSSNEEAQSINEELQSANEELETSKEELQSVNEELTISNTELEDKIRSLTRANNDLNNLLAGTGIGTLFVDHGLRIMRFTPTVRAIINLRPGDAGRPLAHISSNFAGYTTLLQDTQAVLETLLPKECEVQTTESRWYTLRIQPYRTIDNVIEGAVISFIEITETVRAREELKRVAAHMRHATLLLDMADALVVQSVDGRILAWNPAAERLYGWSEAEALQLKAIDRLPPTLRNAPTAGLDVPAQAWPMRADRTQRLTKAGAVIDVSVVASNLVDDAGACYAIAATERALTVGSP